MKVLLIARASLYKEPGGDTIQITATAKYLRLLGVEADIKLTHEVKDYMSYDLLHFFNIFRPADMLVHIRRSKKPFVVSTIYVEYLEYDKKFRQGLSRIIFKILPLDFTEYVKVIARRFSSGERIMSREYLWLGQKKSIQQILLQASFLLPNSYNEYSRLQKQFILTNAVEIVANGIDQTIFRSGVVPGRKDKLLVLCVGRIEGLKNQLNLIKALNGSRFTLLLIGKHAVNQPAYWHQCKEVAGENVHFIESMPQEELVDYYTRAKVHVLASWFETTGLSSLEAAAMGCNIVITDRGDAKEYFGADAWYCDPSSPESILKAVEQAANADYNDNLSSRIYSQYTWEVAATQTLKAYTASLKNYM